MIKKAVLSERGYQTYSDIRRKIIAIINRVVKEIEIVELKKATANSLLKFGEQLYAKSIIYMGVPANSFLLAYGTLKQNVPTSEVIERFSIKTSPVKSQSDTIHEIAQPNQMYNKDYHEGVRKALNEIVKEEPMYDDHISLRNIAEMTVRYDKTLKSIDNLVRQGVNLVVSSRHANCSKRCEKWQGGHYTLDNTYQIVDGIEFQPLSNATDQYYVTKAGKVYKNGHITGYNCRHYLMPYRKGYEQPMVSAKTVAKERDIDQHMRYMERQVRFWRDKAITYKGVDQETYAKARVKAIQYNRRYIEYAKANSRAYYPSRTEVI